MTHWSQRTTCPDCNAPLAEIRIIDKAHLDRQEQLEYSADPREQEYLLGIFPQGFKIHGRVQAKMCSDCGRIILYGMPFQFRKVD